MIGLVYRVIERYLIHPTDCIADAAPTGAVMLIQFIGYIPVAAPFRL